MLICTIMAMHESEYYDNIGEWLVQKNHMMPVRPQAYRIKIVGWPFLMG